MTSTLPVPLDVKLMNLTASVLFAGCVLAVLAAGVSWVLRYPGFSIARIVVQGDLVHNNAVTLRANVMPHLAGNFFTVDLRAARAAFEQVPWVRRAQVQRIYPGSLRVELQEHEAAAYWGPESGSALVQKTYSANYPGEFGGGVINLTTKAIPDKNFWSAGFSVSADTVTTSELGYTYEGGDWDWTGFDDGTRGSMM